MTYQKLNRDHLKTLPLKERVNKMTLREIHQLDDEIPDYADKNLKLAAGKIIEAREKNKEIIWMIGAHVIRKGNSRFIIDLMEKGFITHLATNGAGIIHDFELALIGETCEDVEFYIKDGKFGNWEETGKYINLAIATGRKNRVGYGESIGKMIETEKRVKFPHKEISVAAAAFRLKIPLTVHKGIGCDITDQHPSADYAAIGYASGEDFLIFADSIYRLNKGVFLNIGSAVTGPEVFLKALSMARNITTGKGGQLKDFTTINFDILDLKNWRKEDQKTDPLYYYRPKKTILIRTVKDGGISFHIKGDFAVTIPNLYRLLIKRR